MRLTFFTVLSAILVGAHGFDPRAYDAEAGKEATCGAVKRTVTLLHTAGWGLFKSKETLVVEKEEVVTTQIRYIDINPTAEKTILMVHGWPGLWSTWAYQIEEFKNDFRLIVPNLRGFGNSTLPGNLRSSGTMQDLVSDMACVLKHAGVDDVICMGHDWGSQICYEMGRARPDITSAIVGVPIPKRDTVLGPFGSQAILPITYLTSDEEDYLVEQFEIQGFKNTLYFYATENRYQSWKFPYDQDNHAISQPVLTVYPTKDFLVNWKLIAFMLRSSKYIPNLTTETVPGAHFPHMENPEAFNGVVRQWMLQIGISEIEEKGRVADEF